MIKVKLCLLAIITVLSVGLGGFCRNHAYAAEFSVEPNSETYELLAGQAQSFIAQIDVNGVNQALSSLESQAACQEKICVCSYQLKTTTLRMRDGAVEQIGTTVSPPYDCRDIAGGAVLANVTYSVSISEPGMNYFLNVSQLVSTDGASFGADGDTRVLGVEVHQVNVKSKEGDVVVNDIAVSDGEPNVMPDVAVAESDADESGGVGDDAGEDSLEVEDEAVGGGEYELLMSDVSLDELAEALAMEQGNTFTIKIGDGVVLNSAVLGAVKDSGKNLVIRKYQDEQVLYEWKMQNGVIDVTRDFDPTVVFESRDEAEIGRALGELNVTGDTSKIQYFRVLQVGTLPSGTKLRVLVSGGLVNDVLNLYNYDYDLAEIEVAYEKIKVNDGYAEFGILRGSDGYFLTPAQIVTVIPDDEIIVSDGEEDKGSNWLLAGILGFGGILGAGGAAGFWIWKKRYNDRGGVKVENVIEKEDASNVADENVKNVTILAEPESVRSPRMLSSGMVNKKALPMQAGDVGVRRNVKTVARSVSTGSGRRVMDMVRRPNVASDRKVEKIIPVDDVVVKGSSKRLVIS